MRVACMQGGVGDRARRHRTWTALLRTEVCLLDVDGSGVCVWAESDLIRDGTRSEKIVIGRPLSLDRDMFRLASRTNPVQWRTSRALLGCPGHDRALLKGLTRWES